MAYNRRGGREQLPHPPSRGHEPEQDLATLTTRTLQHLVDSEFWPEITTLDQARDFLTHLHDNKGQRAEPAAARRKPQNKQARFCRQCSAKFLAPKHHPQVFCSNHCWHQAYARTA